MIIKVLNAKQTERSTFIVEYTENNQVLKVVETNVKSPFVLQQLASQKLHNWKAYILNGVYIVRAQRLI